MSLFSCAKCGAQFSKWAGRCTECGAWGTVAEETVAAEAASRVQALPGKAQAFSALPSSATQKHLASGVKFWDELLSGGLIAGSVTLLGGEPGIGKSTLLAQLGLALTKNGKSVLYATGEESPEQVRLRLERLAGESLPASFFCLDSTDAPTIAATLMKEKPALTIVDSIQTLRTDGITGEAGNPTQLKASVALLTEAAKKSGAPMILVGQVTKDGDLAGPRLVEHLVDTVLMLEGDRHHTLRLLRLLKHRFGNTDGVVALLMNEHGLEEVLDPSSLLLADRPTGAAGTIVSCLMQGRRALLVEIQALTNPAGFGTPTRRASGIDTNRLSLLLAVLARRAGLPLGEQDVFVNAIGGIEAKEPAMDVALALALASAKYDLPLPDDVIAWGEIGLSGEIRPVEQEVLRIKEAERLGFKTVIAPTGDATIKTNIKIIRCKTVREAMETLTLKKQH